MATKEKDLPNPEGKGSTTTREQMRERLDFVAELLASPLTYGEVVDAVCAEYEVGARMAKRYVAKVWDRWEKESRTDRDMNRERQVRRILKRIVQHDGGTKETSKRPDLAFKYEQLLARITGTLAPVRVIAVDDVDVGALTDDQLRRIATGEDPNVVLGNARAEVH